MGRLRYVFIITLIFSLALISSADEGMWMPHQMKGLKLKAKGLEMDPGDLYKKRRNRSDECSCTSGRRNRRICKP